MTLKDFLEKYDKAGSIVLLEGKRKVPESDAEKLTRLGRLLAEKSSHIIFRSGNAEGSDHLFSQGVASVCPQRLQVITPYAGHRQKHNQAYETFPLDNINMAEEPEVVYQSKQNKRVGKLIDQYVEGQVNRISIKAAYIIRDTVKVIGTSEIPPATVGIFYNDLARPEDGGTGHTINICKQNNVPSIDQTIWIEWLEVEND